MSELIIIMTVLRYALLFMSMKNFYEKITCAGIIQSLTYGIKQSINRLVV